MKKFFKLIGIITISILISTGLCTLLGIKDFIGSFFVSFTIFMILMSNYF